MNVERMADDGIEVAQFLAKHLNKKKTTIYSGSWVPKPSPGDAFHV